MAQRRDRPPVERAGDSLNIKLPDGTTMSVPLNASSRSPTVDLCCFCGERVQQADPSAIRIDARWEQGGDERRRSWRAHHRCLFERIDDRVKGEEPSAND